MTPEDIVRMVELDMKEGSMQYQPAYWKTRLLLRIKAMMENERAKALKDHQCVKDMGMGPTGP